MSVNEVRALLARMDRADLHSVLDVLRKEHKLVIHPIEEAWSTTAEAVLEAIYAARISRSVGCAVCLQRRFSELRLFPALADGRPSILKEIFLTTC